MRNMNWAVRLLGVLCASMLLLSPSAPARADDSSASTSAATETPSIKPTAMTFEVSVFLGGISFSENQGLRGTDGIPARKLARTALEAGVRLGFFPTTFLGAEVEGMAGLGWAENLRNGERRAAFLYSGRGHLVLQLPVGPLTPFILGGGGALGLVSTPVGDDLDLMGYFGGGLKYAATETLSLRVDVRDLLTAKVTGSKQPHNLEVLMGVTWVFPGERLPPPVLDGDGDGVPDEADKCPDLVGDGPDGCMLDGDGDGVPDAQDQCPEVAGDTANGCLADRDGDGVPDASDQCPDEAATTETGCLADTDGDGVPDTADLCPGVKGDNPSGCLEDTDKDGIPDQSDKCQTEPETRNGFEDTDGCPDELPEAVKKFSGVIEGILFESGKANIKTSSKAKLDDAAKVLSGYAALRLKITGHTDSSGDHDKNVELSKERAEAVKTYLVSQGIAADRLETVGIGPDQPVADNKTRKGRAKNRRIEFALIQEEAPSAPAPAPAAPAPAPAPEQ